MVLKRKMAGVQKYLHRKSAHIYARALMAKRVRRETTRAGLNKLRRLNPCVLPQRDRHEQPEINFVYSDESTLQPLITQQTRRPWNREGCSRRAPTANAPVGSAFTLANRNNNRTASTMFCSDTSTMSLTSLCIIGQFALPTLMVRAPSAMVAGSLSFLMTKPARRERAASFANSGSAPTMSVCWPALRNPRATPEINPPPPTGTRKKSQFAASGASSAPRVALPSMMCSSSYAFVTYASECSLVSCLSRASRLICAVSIKSTIAPWLRTDSTFTVADVVGITIIQALFSSLQA